MTKLLAVCCLALLAALTAVQVSAQDKQALRLFRTIPLPGIAGRLDHMGVDLEKKRLFVAAVTNNTLEVLDLTEGKALKSLTGLKDTQDALFLGGDFNKLYVSRERSETMGTSVKQRARLAPLVSKHHDGLVQQLTRNQTAIVDLVGPACHVPCVA